MGEDGKISGFKEENQQKVYCHHSVDEQTEGQEASVNS